MGKRNNQALNLYKSYQPAQCSSINYTVNQLTVPRDGQRYQQRQGEIHDEDKIWVNHSAHEVLMIRRKLASHVHVKEVMCNFQIHHRVPCSRPNRNQQQRMHQKRGDARYPNNQRPSSNLAQAQPILLHAQVVNGQKETEPNNISG